MYKIISDSQKCLNFQIKFQIKYQIKCLYFNFFL